MDPQHTPHHTPHAPIKPDPTRSSKTWAIALIVSAIFLLAAAGVIAWIVVSRSGKLTSALPPTDPAFGVKNTTVVLPADVPATYVKHDQSKVDQTTVYYDDEASTCSLVTMVLPVVTDKSPGEVVLGALAAGYASGVTITKTTDAEKLSVKDADGKNTYNFDAFETEQSVDMPAVSFTGRHQITVYRQLGNQIVAIGYGCKNETWADKKAELAALVGQVTVKTER